MSEEIIYVCWICKRVLNPSTEDVHVLQDGTVYCRHCWSEWGRWAGSYGLDVVTE